MPTHFGLDIGGTSVKSALWREDGTFVTGRSEPYARPTRQMLVTAIGQPTTASLPSTTRVGICLPGLFDPSTRTVTAAVNVPGIVGVPIDQLLTDALGFTPARVRVFSDAHAAAHDLYVTRQITGRLFLLALGTGIGAAVLDDHAIPLRVDGDSPGHFGQLDVSLDDTPPPGPDGGAGSLEGYLGLAALLRQYGPTAVEQLPTLPINAPPVRALVRAIRIAHAIYRPRQVMLAGGVGIGLRTRLPELHAAISKNLTGIARQGWTLDCGDSVHHAARGAARLVNPIPI